MAADVQRRRARREHGGGPAAAEAVAAVPAGFGLFGEAGGLAPGRDDGADGLRAEPSVAAASARDVSRGRRVRPQRVGVPAAGRRADVAPAVDAGEQRAGRDASRGQEGRPRQYRAHRADLLVGGVVDPADHSAGGLVGLGRADRHRDALARHQLDVAEVERREFGAAGEEGEAEQHDSAVTEAGRRLVVARRDDRRQVRGHDRHGLARTRAPVARRLPAPRGDHDLARRQRVGRRRPGAAMHRPDRGEVRVNGGGLQPSLGGEVGQVGRHRLRGGRQRYPARAGAPRLEGAPARPVGERRVGRHCLRDQRGGLLRDLEVGRSVADTADRCAQPPRDIASCCYHCDCQATCPPSALSTAVWTAACHATLPARPGFHAAAASLCVAQPEQCSTEQ